MHGLRVPLACLLVLAAAPAEADDSGVFPVEVCIKARGLDPEALKSTGQRVSADLEVLDARILPGPQGGTGAVDCKQKDFLRAAHKRGAQGLVDIHILRFGPLVRITIRVFYPATGQEVLHIKAKAKSTNFPTNTSLEDVLQRGLDNLRGRKQALARKHQKAKPDKPGQGTGKPGGGKPDGGRTQPVVATRDPGIEEVPPLAPEFMVLETTAPPRDTTWYWIGGAVLTGGLVISGVGAYVLAGPYSTAVDRRDRAHDEYNEDGHNEEYYEQKLDEMMEQDDKASKYNTIGWATIGVGAALAVGGLVVILMEVGSGPGADPEKSSGAEGTGLRPALSPVLAPGGGGLVLQWTW